MCWAGRSSTQRARRPIGRCVGRWATACRTSHDISDLPWTGRATREAMRMYPSAHIVGRLSGRGRCAGRLPHPGRFGRGDLAAGHPSIAKVLARSRHLRSTPIRPAGRPVSGRTYRYAWVPFAAGPHTCIGMQLALLEATIVLATILRAFRVRTSFSSIPLTAAVTLRPAGPLPVRLHLER